MSREIKFRAWDTAYKLMFYNPLDCRDKGSLVISKYACWDNVIKDTSFEVMQFIGLKDKNGKEIYEGDIVSLDGNLTADNPMGLEPNGYMFDETDVFVTVWNEQLACWDLDFYRYEKDNGEELEWKYKRDSRCLFVSNACEVIGNIHENKDLLP